MSRIKNTPLLAMRGRYVLEEPFVIDNAQLYICQALRSFKEILDTGFRLYDRVYLPLNVPKETYEEDVRINATLVTLYADDGTSLLVPDTFIKSYPMQALPDYAHYVISASFGPLRQDLNTTQVEEGLKDLISDLIGTRPEVFVDIMKSNNDLSPEDAEAIEVARLASIRRRDSTYVQLLKAQETIRELNARLDVLEPLLPKV